MARSGASVVAKGMALKFDEAGLIPAIAQDRMSGEVRMVGWMNSESIAHTQATGFATFYSRSRQQIWTKGETSGNTLRVHRIVADCDSDTLLLEVDPTGPTCHTGSQACFFRPLWPDLEPAETRALPMLFELESIIESRTSSDAAKSYTKSLLDAGTEKIGAKLREEAGELADAISAESDARVVNEACDLFYHALVALRARGISLGTVAATLGARMGTSGLVEKASRSR